MMAVTDAEALTSLGRVKDYGQAGWSTVCAVDHSYDRGDWRVRPEMTSDACHPLTLSPWLDVNGSDFTVHRSTSLPLANYDV